MANFVQTWVNELRSIPFWKAILAELLGTLLLVFIGCASCLDNWQKEAALGRGVTVVQISLTFGLAVATVVWCIAHVSGGHINPAVTAGMLIARKITVIRAIFYVIAQCAGAILGAGLLHLLHPNDHLQDGLGNTGRDPKVRLDQAFGIELVITFVLVFTVFASCDKYRNDLGGSVPLTIGFSITVCHLFAIKYTGSSMNPARSFGPAVIANRWADHWLYWVGPISGCVLAALVYDLVFAADASIKKVKGVFSPNGPSQEPAQADPHRKAEPV